MYKGFYYFDQKCSNRAQPSWTHSRTYSSTPTQHTFTHSTICARIPLIALRSLRLHVALASAHNFAPPIQQLQTPVTDLFSSDASPLPPEKPVARTLREQVQTVSSLLTQVRSKLESEFPLQWVSGEISNLVRAASGHIYFSLKDSTAQVRCAFFRNRAQLAGFKLENGQQVEIRALPTLYEARGDFQLVVEAVRQAGIGNLFEQFVRLKQKLEAEGLFDAARKRPLPSHPQGIGIISSPQAAALRDILIALQRRAPHVPVVLYPCAVQGADAPAQLRQALAKANQRGEVDVLIIARGGGSIEDLWAFNDEQLARDIAHSKLPIVSGVGHETDFTLSDFVADLRAATPTAAAELVSQGHVNARATLPTLARRLQQNFDRHLQQRNQRVDQLAQRLLSPTRQLERQRERLAHLKLRLKHPIQAQLQQHHHQLQVLTRQLTVPNTAPLQARLQQQAHRLQLAKQGRLQQLAQQLDTLHSHLQHLNPRAVLGRGYSLVKHADGRLVKAHTELHPNDKLHIEFGDGWAETRVESSGPDNSQK